MGGVNSGKMDDVAIIKLDGTLIKQDGSLSRTKMFDFLDIDLDDYSDIKMTPQEAQRFMNHVRRMKTGVSAFVPMLCASPHKCPMGVRCPITERWPVGRACPLESNYIRVQTKEYVQSLDVDPQNTYEMVLVNELVEIDLLGYRANVALSGDKEDGPRLLTTIRTESEEKVMESTIPHPLLEIKEKLNKRRLQILESFAVTRKEQYKKAAALKQKSSADVSTHLAELRKTIEKMQKATSTKELGKIVEEAKTDSKVIEADWEAIP
jgi:hypothetical protein